MKASYRWLRELLPSLSASSKDVAERFTHAGLEVEGVIEYGDGRVIAVVVISELRDGKMWRDRWYFAEPFEAPEWRAQWVERMDL